MAARLLHFTKKDILGGHNNLIKYITGLIDTDRFLMYADIPSHTLPGGGTVPHLLVTTEKPDLVIIRVSTGIPGYGLRTEMIRNFFPFPL